MTATNSCPHEAIQASRQPSVWLSHLRNKGSSWYMRHNACNFLLEGFLLSFYVRHRTHLWCATTRSTQSTLGLFFTDAGWRSSARRVATRDDRETSARWVGLTFENGLLYPGAAVFVRYIQLICSMTIDHSDNPMLHPFVQEAQSLPLPIAFGATIPPGATSLSSWTQSGRCFSATTSMVHLHDAVAQRSIPPSLIFWDLSPIIAS